MTPEIQKKFDKFTDDFGPSLFKKDDQDIAEVCFAGGYVAAFPPAVPLTIRKKRLSVLLDAAAHELQVFGEPLAGHAADRVDALVLELKAAANTAAYSNPQAVAILTLAADRLDASGVDWLAAELRTLPAAALEDEKPTAPPQPLLAAAEVRAEASRIQVESVINLQNKLLADYCRLYDENDKPLDAEAQIKISLLAKVLSDFAIARGVEAQLEKEILSGERPVKYGPQSGLANWARTAPAQTVKGGQQDA